MADDKIYRLRIIDRNRVEVDTSPKRYQVVLREGTLPETRSTEYVIFKRENREWETGWVRCHDVLMLGLISAGATVYRRASTLFMTKTHSLRSVLALGGGRSGLFSLGGPIISFSNVMRRIVVFGNSGSGKTTLARVLTSQYGLAHLDLDSLAWDSPGVRRSPHGERKHNP